MKNKIFIFTFVLSLSTWALPLSNKALFYRCYKSITQQFPHPENTLIAQVKNGIKTPIDACIEVLDKASFTTLDGNKMGDTNDSEAIAALRTMHYLHFSWFTLKTIPNYQSHFLVTKSFIDINGPAARYTKSLFDDLFEFQNVFDGVKHFESLRSDPDPAVAPISGLTDADFPRLYPPYTFTQKGPLNGVKIHDGKVVSYRQLVGGQVKTSTFNWGFHLGGGILGSNMYVLKNLVVQGLFKTDGAKKMPRSFAMNLVSDFLCREIPVVRYEDTLGFVVNGSETEFRRDGACMRCHLTIDRTSAVIRNVHYKGRLMSVTPGEIQRQVELNQHGTTMPAETTAWSDVADPDFYKRPPSGYFTYRTHDGILIKRPLTNMTDLANTLKSLDDTYICVAKRYYKYFTGIDANIEDIGDPQYPHTLTTAETAHRNEVINLGKAFHNHQNLKQLIKDILNKPQYQESDFKLTTN